MLRQHITLIFLDKFFQGPQVKETEMLKMKLERKKLQRVTNYNYYYYLHARPGGSPPAVTNYRSYCVDG